MEFLFSPIGSKILDFLMFPSFVLQSEDEEYQEHAAMNVFEESYLQMNEQILQDLRPFAEAIKEFYIGDFSLAMELYRQVTITEKDSPVAVLEKLAELDEQTQRKAILTGLYAHMNVEEPEDSESLVTSKAAAIDLIKNTDLEASVKWKFFVMVDNPGAAVSRMVDLLKQLYPLFTKYHAQVEDEVMKYATGFIQRANEAGLKIFSSILNDAVEDNVFAVIKERDTLEIYMLGVNRYNLAYILNEEKPVIAVGIGIEQVNSRLRDIYDGKLKVRAMVFKNLGDSTRYDVLRLIANGTTSTKEMAEIIGVTSAAISYHIKQLTSAGLLKIDRSDKSITHKLDTRFLSEVIEGLKEDLHINEAN